jgi:hypothetical protein
MGLLGLGMRNLPARLLGIEPSGHLRQGRVFEECPEFSARGFGHLGGT